MLSKCNFSLFSYFADTLANQEASRYESAVGDVGISPTDYMVIHRTGTGNIRGNTPENYISSNQQQVRPRIGEIASASLRKQYNSHINTSLSCGAYRVT